MSKETRAETRNLFFNPDQFKQQIRGERKQTIQKAATVLNAQGGTIWSTKGRGK